jgi:hypothetical protein
VAKVGLDEAQRGVLIAPGAIPSPRDETRCAAPTTLLCGRHA